MKPWIGLQWQVGGLSGWGQFGAHFARTLAEAGHTVIVPPPDYAGILPSDRALFRRLPSTADADTPGILCFAIGNACEPKPKMPPKVKCVGIIAIEDTGAIAAKRLNEYDLIVALSSWTFGELKARGVKRVVLAHQGYDERTFTPGEPVTHGRPVIFSGGKLEFRKGQDIAVEAFKRFRLTPEGKDALLVAAWHNPFPATMLGIDASGYTNGLPYAGHDPNRQYALHGDLSRWLLRNGVPLEAQWITDSMTPIDTADVLQACTCAIFPNRAESATNMVLMEALGVGLPCFASSGHGHQDVADWPQRPARPIPPGCTLYQSTDGWTETDPDEIVEWLKAPTRIEPKMDFGWNVRGPAMLETILGAL